MKTIELDSTTSTIVSDEDYDYLQSVLAPRAFWHLVGNRVKATVIIGRRVIANALIYRVIMRVADKRYPFVDHIDGDPLNNTRENLRFVTRSQSQMNRFAHGNSQTGYKGVLPYGKDKYRSFIYKERKQYFLGYFNSLQEAVIAYNQAAVKLHGEYAKLNKFPGDVTPTK